MLHGTGGYADEGLLSKALGLVYESVMTPELWPEALEHLSAYVGGSSAMLFHQDQLAKSGNMLHAFNADAEYTRLYFEKYVAMNPVLPFTMLMDIGSCTSFLRIIDAEEFRASRFYVEWAAPQRFWDVVVTILDKSATSMGLFGVTRLESEGAAGETEIARMALVAPHVRRAVTFARLFEGLNARADGLAQAIDGSSDAIVLLDQVGTVVFANVAAQQLRGHDAPIRLEDGRLRAGAEAPAAQAFLDPVALARMIRTGAEIDLGHRWFGHVMPLAVHRQQVGSGAPAAVLSIRRAAGGSLGPMEGLAKQFGFTPRELQVFMGIVQFGGVPEVAQMFGISATTVRTHLQRVFDKTGVRDQRDLIRVAMSTMGPPPGS